MKMRELDLIERPIQGWTGNDSEMSGVWTWTNPELPEIEIYATPDWSEDGITPFAIQINGGEYYELGSVKNERYVERLKEVIELINGIRNTKFLQR